MNNVRRATMMMNATRTAELNGVTTQQHDVTPLVCIHKSMTLENWKNSKTQTKSKFYTDLVHLRSLFNCFFCIHFLSFFPASFSVKLMQNLNLKILILSFGPLSCVFICLFFFCLSTFLPPPPPLSLSLSTSLCCKEAALWILHKSPWPQLSRQQAVLYVK